MIKSEKLVDVWRKHADKIVDLGEVQQSLIALLEARLDDAEKEQFISVADKASPFTQLPQYVRSYKGKNSDGKKSVFADTGSIMMAFNRTSPSLGSLQEKVGDIMAEVFEKAADYQPSVDSGKIKRFELPRLY